MNLTQSHTKLSVRIFTEAAKELTRLYEQSTRGCCWAIDSACCMHVKGDYYQEVKRYMESMNAAIRPRSTNGRLWWYTAKLRRCRNTPEDIRTARVIGLLLCAELVRDGWTVEDFLEGAK